MKNPLHYQFTEYDCGPTTMVNAIGYLFEREEIPPDIIRTIQLYCLDTVGSDGSYGAMGTTRMAMMFLSSWLDNYGHTGRFPVSSRYLRGDEVFIGETSRINDALRRHGAAVVRLYLDVEHYVLMTGAEDGRILLFDPYLDPDQGALPPGCVRVTDRPFSCNRIIPFEVFNTEAHTDYALGEKPQREAVLIFNEKTALTAEKTIEYFI